MTQYEMHGIEALGLLKFDFLGLSNLTILRDGSGPDPRAPRGTGAGVLCPSYQVNLSNT
ncbi:MAG: hypothetical protein MZW92_59040 [Comamonadaceae bacterium]|nr:hypothetical protein [Comamonadaceae bacterium]